MTKFILHGGDTSDKNSDNNYFFRELVNGLADKITILLCYFSSEKSEWEMKSKQDITRITKLNPKKKLTFLTADSRKLKVQLAKSDVFYMRGGDTQMLLETLQKTPNFKNILDNKTIAGSSAGAYALAKYFYSISRKQVFEGLGFLNVQCTCHFTPENKKAIESLKKHSKLPIIVLPNYKSLVLYT